MKKKFILTLIYFNYLICQGQAYKYYIPAPEGSGLYGYCDTNGVTTIPPIPYRTSFFDFNATAEISGNHLLKGRIDSTGRIIVPCKFTETVAFSDGFTRVANPENQGIYNYQGKLIIPLNYDHIGLDQNGVFYCTKEHLTQIFTSDDKGNYKNILSHKEIEFSESQFENGLMLINIYFENGTVKVYNSKGKFLREEKSSEDENTMQDILPDMGDSGPMYDWKNKQTIPVIENKEGKYFIARKSLATGEIFIDNTLKPEFYERIINGYPYDLGYFIAKKEGKWGIIDPSNKIVIPFKYDSISGASDFVCSRGYLNDNDGLIFNVSLNGQWGLLNHKHQDSFILNPKYDYIGDRGNCSVVVLTIGSKYGMAFLRNGQRKSLIDPKYNSVFLDELRYFPNGRILVLVSDNQEFYIDSKGFEYKLR